MLNTLEACLKAVDEILLGRTARCAWPWPACWPVGTC